MRIKMLGEEFCSHNIEIGVKRKKEQGYELLQGSGIFRGNKNV